MHFPFDIMAETYDTEFTHSNIGQLQRKQVWEFLFPVLTLYSKPLKILEINCGTGEDAVRLACLGHSVIATDISEKMIEKARYKTALLKEDLEFFVCSFENLALHFNDKKFDLIISNFGGLNCIDKNAVEKLGLQLSEMLQPNGKLFLVLMGRYCLWEIIYFSIRGRINTAFRRQRKSAIFKWARLLYLYFIIQPDISKRSSIKITGIYGHAR